MTIVALASIKGSPGVTTAATAMAATWPARRKVLLVEADPFGGDLAPRYGASVTGGLASLFAAARRALAPDAVWDYVHELPGGLPVLFGLTGVHQAVANEQVWPAIAKALAGLDADVVVDAGRLLPNSGGGVRAVLDQADAVIVVCEPTLEHVVHLRDALPGLVAELRGRRLLVVPTGAVGYAAEDIAKTLQVTVLRPMPNDPTGAAALANKRSKRRLERTRLLKWAATVVAELGITERPVIDEAAAECLPVAEPLGEAVTGEPPRLSPGPSTREPELLGAGGKWETAQ